MVDHHPDLYAYVGRDEFGSNEVGLKQGLTPAGMIPLVSTDRAKLEQEYMLAGMDEQARWHRVEIRLTRYVAVEVVRTFNNRDDALPPTPHPLVRCYADVLGHVSRAVQQHAEINDPQIRALLERAMLVLRGHLEGLALAWHALSGEREEADDELRAAALEWQARKR